MCVGRGRRSGLKLGVERGLKVLPSIIHVFLGGIKISDGATPCGFGGLKNSLRGRGVGWAWRTKYQLKPCNVW
jgi:hypothetical protein